MKIEKKLIKELVDDLDEFKLSEIEYGNKEIKIKVSKNINQNIVSTVKKNISEQKQDVVIEGTKIKSPIIGTAYLSPEPGAKKFIEIGQKIKKGDTVMIVEAMKTMNHVPSLVDGIVKAICVKDSQPVEYGQDLVILD